MNCELCSYVTGNASTLKTHRYRKHPEIKWKLKLKRSSNPKQKKSVRKWPLSQTAKDGYKDILTNEYLKEIDGLSVAHPDEVQDVLRVFLSQCKVTICKTLYHVTCLQPDKLMDIAVVEEVLPIHCRCFCNLLPETEDVDKAVNDIIADDGLWHQHNIVRVKEDISLRTIEAHFNAMFGDNNYVCFKINDSWHYLNVILYIYGRENHLGIKTHTHQSCRFFLEDWQKANIRRIVGPSVECTTKKGQRLKKKFDAKQKKYVKKTVKQKLLYS